MTINCIFDVKTTIFFVSNFSMSVTFFLTCFLVTELLCRLRMIKIDRTISWHWKNKTLRSVSVGWVVKINDYNIVNWDSYLFIGLPWPRRKNLLRAAPWESRAVECVLARCQKYFGSQVAKEQYISFEKVLTIWL